MRQTTWIDFGDVKVIGDIERDAIGDLHVRNLQVEIWVGQRLMAFRPDKFEDIQYLRDRLLIQYEHERTNETDHGETWREDK